MEIELFDNNLILVLKEFFIYNLVKQNVFFNILNI